MITNKQPNAHFSEERFNDVPDDVRDFLKNLRHDEVALLQEGINLVKTLKTFSKVMKWLILSVFGAIIGGMTLYKQIAEFIGMIKGIK